MKVLLTAHTTGEGTVGRGGTQVGKGDMRGVPDSDHVTHLERLQRWLVDEPELRGHVTQVRAAPGTHHMAAGVLEGLLLTLGSGTVAVLARTLPIWLRQQRSEVEIELTRDEGTSVRIKADNLQDAEALIRRILDDASPRD
ncbi:hypothetical protein [Streptomyces sp. NPDC086989]|uniref:effector-associated constant component EACC1 n=1 Tax=Streptomyces sp. NPDC086989 TaxID=3365764 RepID=UPI00382C8B8A